MKKVLFTLAIVAVTLISCSTDDSTNSTPPAGATGTLLKQIVETYEDGSISTLDYEYSGNKITKLTVVSDFGNGTETEVTNYTYTGEFLTKTEDYTDGILDYTIDLEYDANDKLITETTIFPGQTPEVNTYVHNADGTVTFNEAGGSIVVYTYDNGDLITEDNTNGNQDYTIVYDNKNGALKNIHQREVFELMGYYAYNHNFLSYTNTGGASYNENETYSYTYNTDDYPITAINTVDPGTADEEIITSTYTYY